VSLADYEDFHDAYNPIGRFIDEVHMWQRIHSSLGWLTPAEYGQPWRAQQHVPSPKDWKDLRFCVQVFTKDNRKEHTLWLNTR
jgi:hypothetical protein